MPKRYMIYVITTAVLLLGSIACIRVGELEIETQKVELGGAEQVKLELKIRAGE
jgi:hypothetical protein